MPKTLRQFLFILGILIALRCAPFFWGKTLFWGDNYSLLVPGKMFTATWIQKGILPLWNPYLLGGISWIGDISQSILYPSTLLFIILPTALALNITVIVHLFLTAGGMFYLGRKLAFRPELALIMAVLWTFSTQVAGSTNNLATLQSISWTPWVLAAALGLDRTLKSKLALAVMVLMQLSGGYPQHVIFSMMMAMGLTLIYSPKAIGIWLKALLLTGLLSAFIWLPFVKVFWQSTRTGQSLLQAQSGSLQPMMLVKFILPYAFDLPIIGMRWGPAWSGQPNMAIYLTWFPLSLLIWYRKDLRRIRKTTRYLLIMTGLTTVLAVGGYLPFYRYIQRVLPIFQIGRYPSILLVLTNICLIILTGKLLTKAMAETKPRKFPYKIFTGIVLFLTLGLLWMGKYGQLVMGRLLDWVQIFAGKSAFHTPEKDTIIVMVILASVIVAGNLTLAAWAAVQKKQYLTLGLIIGLDLIIFTQGIYFFGDKSIYDQPNSAVSWEMARLSENGQYRFLTQNFNVPYTDFGSYWEALAIRQPFSHSEITSADLRTLSKLKRLQTSLTPDWNLTVGTSYIHGYTTLMPQAFTEIWNKTGETRINYLPQIEPTNPQLASWAVKYYVVDKQFNISQANFTDLPLAYENESVRIYALENAEPRYRFENGSLAKFTDYAATPNGFRATLLNPENHQTLVIADRYDADWKTTINGKSTPTMEYNGMRKILLVPGENRIVQTYQPTLFYFGLWLSGGCLVAVVVYMRVKRKI